MNFLEIIFARLETAGSAPVLREIHAGRIDTCSAAELLGLVAKARQFIRATGLAKGDRCGLLGPNSIRWAAVDLALMAEGVIVVPLYARQAPIELAGMMKDCAPSRLLCADAALRDSIAAVWPGAPPASLFDEMFIDRSGAAGTADSVVRALPRPAPSDADPVTIIYTSGTSGEPKGVVLNVTNVSHMIPCTTSRLDQLMALFPKQDRAEQIFHYLPLSFAASWLLLLTALSRNSVLSLSTDLTRLADEIKAAAPDYSLNVPTLLERIRTRVEGQISQRGGIASGIFARAKAAYERKRAGTSKMGDSLWLMLADKLIFAKIRANIGPNIKALICGSAPLAVETQLFFMMLGIPVLQAYGLTETTGICTLDVPGQVDPGFVGHAIPGIEMKLGENS